MLSILCAVSALTFCVYPAIGKSVTSRPSQKPTITVKTNRPSGEPSYKPSTILLRTSTPTTAEPITSGPTYLPSYFQRTTTPTVYPTTPTYLPSYFQRTTTPTVSATTPTLTPMYVQETASPTALSFSEPTFLVRTNHPSASPTNESRPHADDGEGVISSNDDGINYDDDNGGENGSDDLESNDDNDDGQSDNTTDDREDNENRHGDDDKENDDDISRDDDDDDDDDDDGDDDDDAGVSSTDSNDDDGNAKSDDKHENGELSSGWWDMFVEIVIWVIAVCAIAVSCFYWYNNVSSPQSRSASGSMENYKYGALKTKQRKSNNRASANVYSAASGSQGSGILINEDDDISDDNIGESVSGYHDTYSL